MSIVIDKSKCIGCKRCRNVCPGSLIKTDENGKAYIKYPKDCWGCTSCIKECPAYAISFFLGSDIGVIGLYFYKNPEIDMTKFLFNLQKIDWKRSSSQWKLRVIRVDGKIITSNKAINLTSNQIKKEIGLPLSEEEEQREQQFLSSINVQENNNHGRKMCEL